MVNIFWIKTKLLKLVVIKLFNIVKISTQNN